MNEAQQQAWRDFEQLFIAAFDNPIARRRHQDEYTVEAREAFHRLRRLIQPHSAGVPAITDFLRTHGIPSTDTIAAAVGGIAATLMPNQNWAQEAVSNGTAATSADEVTLAGGAVGYTTGITEEDRLDSVRLITRHAEDLADRMTKLIVADPKMK